MQGQPLKSPFNQSNNPKKVDLLAILDTANLVKKMRELDDIFENLKNFKNDIYQEHKQTLEYFKKEHEQELIQLDQTLEDFKKEHEQELIQLDQTIERVLQIQKGEPGKDAEPVDTKALVSEVLSKIPKPKDGKTPEIDTIAIAKTAAKFVKVPEIKVPEVQVDLEDIAEKVISLIQDGKKKLSLKHIGDFTDGLEQTIRPIRSLVAGFRGGGDVVKAGTGVTITTDADGKKVINASGGTGSGDVVGPASATDNAITRYDGTTGKLIQNSTVTLSDDGIIGTVKAINYDLTQTGASVEGRAIWDDTSKTLEIGLKNGFPLKVGQQIIELCVNNTGSAIAKGKVVYVNGGSGNRPTITLADNSSDLTSARTFGVTAEAINNNNSGYVVVTGIVDGLNTNAYTAGTQLYLSTSGNMTSTKPVAPAHMVYVARVITQSATVGVIYVQTQNGYELDELHDVLISTPVTGQVLSYDSSDSLWKNSSVFSAMELSSTETPDGSRTTFTFSTATSQPSCLVVDGVWTKATSKSGTINWTWNAGTKVATLTIPAQDDIWGIK